MFSLSFERSRCCRWGSNVHAKRPATTPRIKKTSPFLLLEQTKLAQTRVQASNPYFTSVLGWRWIGVVCKAIITQLISRQIVPKTGYEAGMCHTRLLSKVSNRLLAPPAVICRCVGGYRDLARLLGESCADKKWGAISEKKLYGNREIVFSRTVGGWENTDSWLGAQIGSVLKPIQTLKEYFWSHVYCAHLGIPWYQIVGASRTVSNRESRYPHQNRPTDEQGTIICIWMTLQYFSSLYVQLLMIYCDITAVLLDLRFRSFSHFLFVRVDLNPLKK